MNKLLALGLTLMLSIPLLVSAAGTVEGPQGFAQIQNPLKADTVQGIIPVLMRAVLDIGSIVAVFFIIYAGLKFVMAKGDPTKIAAAKTTLAYTLIGIAVLFGAQLISVLITNTIKNVGSGVIQ